LDRITNRKGSCRNMMPLKEFLGETLTRLELRRRLAWAKHAPSAAIEFIHHAKRQRQLGTNDCEIRLQAVRQRDDRIQTLQVRGKALRLVAYAAIARRATQFRNPRRLPQLPHQRMLAPAAT